MANVTVSEVEETPGPSYEGIERHRGNRAEGSNLRAEEVVRADRVQATVNLPIISQPSRVEDEYSKLCRVARAQPAQ